MKSLNLLIALCLMAASGQNAFAQTRAELVTAFAGDWFVFEPSHASGTDPCQLTLNADNAEAGAAMPLGNAGCSADLSSLETWNVEDGRLVLFTSTGTPLVELGGTQLRLTGTLDASGLAIVAERSGGDGANIEIANAVQRHRCYYLGVTDNCAAEADLQPPVFAGEAPALASVETLGTLVVRSQPRRDAPEVGRIPQGTCVRVNQCLVATDGTWCRARFGDVTAWLARNAVRQNEWPILTFRNGCTEAETAD